MNTKNYHKIYYQKNKEKIKKYNIEWAERNPEKKKLRQKKYREKHKEELSRKHKEWRKKTNWAQEYWKKNKEKVQLKQKEWRKKNPHKTKEYSKRYRETHPEQMKMMKEKYYERLLKEDPEKYKRIRGKSLKLRFKILERDKFTCQYCGKKAPEVKLEIDHIHPKSKGGGNNPDNYITSCRECNEGKGDAILEGFSDKNKS